MPEVRADHDRCEASRPLLEHRGRDIDRDRVGHGELLIGRAGRTDEHPDCPRVGADRQPNGGLTTWADVDRLAGQRTVLVLEHDAQRLRLGPLLDR